LETIFIPLIPKCHVVKNKIGGRKVSLHFKNLNDLNETEIRQAYSKISKLINQHPNYRKNPYVIYRNDQIIGYSFSFVYGNVLKTIVKLEHELNNEQGQQFATHLKTTSINGYEQDYFYVENFEETMPYEAFIDPVDSTLSMERVIDFPIFEAHLPKGFMIGNKIQDKKAIATFLELCYDEDAEYSYRNFEEQMDEYEREEKKVSFLIYDGKKLVAILMSVLNESSKYIDHIVVHPEYRNQGLGQILLNKLIRFHPHLPITLHVYKSNYIAIDFYRKNFFVITEENSFVLKR